MKKAVIAVTVGMILTLFGTSFAVEVLGDFHVRGITYTYADNDPFYSNSYPVCPCDISSSSVDCGNSFSADIVIPYCADDYGAGQYVYWPQSEKATIALGGLVGIGTNTPEFALDVDMATGSGNTFAKFGRYYPIYLVASGPNVGFNAYYDGAWKYGKGSASHHGGLIYFDIVTGNFLIQATSTPGNEGAPATMNSLVTISNSGTLSLSSIPTGVGSNTLCSSAVNSGQIERCGSSKALKESIRDLDMGVATIGKLHPVLFNWKKTGQPDLGFIAEEVAEVSPVLAIYNEQGAPDGVKYMNMTAVLVKAAQEQQKMISELQKSVSEKDVEIQALKKALSEIMTRLAMIENKDAAIAAK